MPHMQSICLLHWNETEAAERLERLRALGFLAYHSTLAGPPLLRQLRENPPAAIVIDLTRLPSHGREVGAALRATKATRFIPLVFVGGEPEKVARVRELLPDAVYSSWDEIGLALQVAITQPPANPVAPASSMDAYAGQVAVYFRGKRRLFRLLLCTGLRNHAAAFKSLFYRAQD